MLIFDSAYIGSFIIVIIQYGEGELTDQVFNPLCTGIVFNCIWLLVQSLFKEVKHQERSSQPDRFLLAQLNQMSTAGPGTESMV